MVSLPSFWKPQPLVSSLFSKYLKLDVCFLVRDSYEKPIKHSILSKRPGQPGRVLTYLHG